jgi:hypothetical protein
LNPIVIDGGEAYAFGRMEEGSFRMKTWAEASKTCRLSPTVLHDYGLSWTDLETQTESDGVVCSERFLPEEPAKLVTVGTC